jgi:hypothetical protein
MDEKIINEYLNANLKVLICKNDEKEERRKQGRSPHPN